MYEKYDLKQNANRCYGDMYSVFTDTVTNISSVNIYWIPITTFLKQSKIKCAIGKP